MRWRFTLACAIIALIILGGLYALGYTGGIYSQMLAELEKAREGTPESGAALEAANELWRQNMTLICTLTGDSHIDSITQSFARAQSFATRDGARHEFIGAITDLISGIEHLREYDRPSARSIF